MGVDTSGTETNKRATGDVTCHWSLADDEDVLFYRCVPKTLCKGTVNIAILPTSFLYATAVDIVRYEEGIETALGVYLQHTALRRINIGGHLPVVNVAWRFLHGLI